MTNYKSNVADYDVLFQVETERAIGIKRHDEDTEVIWLPKSVCEFVGLGGCKRGSVIRVTIPDWLAEKYDMA